MDVTDVTRGTLAYYEQGAEQFRAGTWDHDVSQNIGALLRHLAGPPPLSILDFGCGPGRDLAAFAALGHRVVGLEGAAPFVAMARAAGHEVWQQDFLTRSCRRRISMECLPMRRCFMCLRLCCRVCSRACTAHCGPAVCCSAPTRTVTTRRVGTAIATASITTSRAGGAIRRRQISPSSSTTIDRPACRASSNPGWPACGAGRSRHPADSAAISPTMPSRQRPERGSRWCRTTARWCPAVGSAAPARCSRG